MDLHVLSVTGMHMDVTYWNKITASTSCLTKVMGTNSDMIKLNMKQMGIDGIRQTYFESR